MDKEQVKNEQLIYIVIDKYTGEPITGGGSSTKSYIRAFDNYKSAERSLVGFKSRFGNSYYDNAEIATYKRVSTSG